MNKHYFRTNDLYLASYLTVKDMKFVSVDKESYRAEFIFLDTPKRKKLCENYFNGSELVEPRKYMLAVKDLKQIIYSKY
ncbi:MAG: hypothetical protein HQ538_04005 [Parcubacteria group bacterium]|nr:hypothetical protein [Parcubacteria group bacterium]